ncbi:Tll0287-like domain-containing protein [Kangiella sediminilitoris]|uniref:Tll0287-like domain-containing protein n=1 Tax=Kangiella sediminilitoris TaxID=1144748 RepID=A0A1B3BCR5_9GAMM|nr:DUF3365 domain-containing protein [Kangiella sediminilitoris]AOE50538.1 hypothetical protein KS2013_1829 [Kangiella sediminilitoris]
MKKIMTILAIIVLIAAGGYFSWQYYKDAQEQLWEEKSELAAKTLKPIKESFKSTLMQGMQKGVVEAVNYCNLEASGITENLPQGVEVGRTSHKVRNPQNKPDPLLEGPLNYYLELAKDEQQGRPQITQLPDDSWLYVEPIYAQPMCLACHGKNINPAVKATIDAKYPKDEATGFEDGDFRGMFWMKFKEDFGESQI